MIDDHCHLDFFNEKELEKIMKNSKNMLIVSNSVNLDSCKKNIEISKKYKNVKCAFGMYPEKLTLKKFNEFSKFVFNHRRRLFAMGEIGMDFLHKENPELQEKIFRKQLDMARKYKVPAIIHTRKAEKEILKILEEYKDLKLILHCFSGNFKLIKKAVELGCYFSIPTSIMRTEHFQKMVLEIPKKKILTETDSPYLSPFIGEKNTPINIKESLKKIAEIWKVNFEEVEKQVEENFNLCFDK
ncbi:MAG: TatD family hydrolase [Nanoarchaeota archaeon]|nr:TatD family hydrolase [Nanoarchaeota archaeon]